jgi:hypothetical protein
VYVARLDRTRWEHIQTVFRAAAALPDAERAGFLRTECAEDPELLLEVQALLEADTEGAAVLERGVASLASDLLHGGGACALPPRIGHSVRPGKAGRRGMEDAMTP